MSTRDETRLPRWAQNELRRLRANLEGAERELRQALGEEGSTAFITSGLDEAPLPDGSQIRFRVQPQSSKQWEQYFDCSLNDQGQLEVRSATHIAVLPIAANSILVKLEER